MWHCMTMTSVSESRADGVLPALVHPIDESTNLGGALRVAGEGAVALAQGSTAAGLFVARKGVEVTKELAARARRARKEAAQRARDEAVPLLKSVAGEAPRERSRRGRTTLLVAGVLGVVALGGVVFYRSRRPAHPPIAPTPPRVEPQPAAASGPERAATTVSGPDGSTGDTAADS